MYTLSFLLGLQMCHYRQPINGGGICENDNYKYLSYKKREIKVGWDVRRPRLGYRAYHSQLKENKCKFEGYNDIYCGGWVFGCQLYVVLPPLVIAVIDFSYWSRIVFQKMFCLFGSFEESQGSLVKNPELIWIFEFPEDASVNGVFLHLVELSALSAYSSWQVLV